MERTLLMKMLSGTWPQRGSSSRGPAARACSRTDIALGRRMWPWPCPWHSHSTFNYSLHQETSLVLGASVVAGILSEEQLAWGLSTPSWPLLEEGCGSRRPPPWGCRGLQRQVLLWALSLPGSERSEPMGKGRTGPGGQLTEALRGVTPYSRKSRRWTWPLSPEPVSTVLSSSEHSALHLVVMV